MARVLPNVGGAPSTQAWSPGVSAQQSTARSVTPSGAGVAGIGLREFSPTELYQISDRMQLLVNLANGNVVVRYTNGQVTAEGYGTDISHVYNNLSTGVGMFGRGWSSTVGRDVGLRIDGSTVKLHGPTGYVITFTQRNGSWSADSGANAKLTRNGNGEWTVKWDKTEDRWVFYSNGVLKEMLNNNDVDVDFYYDAANGDRLSAIEDSVDRVTTFDDYVSGNKVQTYTDQIGAKHGPFRYNGDDLVSFQDQGGSQISFRYSGGNLTGITSPQGDQYDLAYDGQRRVTSVTEPTAAGKAAPVTRYAYPSSTRTTSTDARGGTSTYTFDDRGRQTKATDQNGNEQSKTWNANSDVASTTNGLGANITYGFDGNNNPTSATLPTGARNTVGYTDGGHPFFPTSTVDPQGNELRGSYNASGDLVTVRSIQQNRDVWNYEYNDAGQPTEKTDGDDRTTYYQYDPQGRLVVTIPPEPMGRTIYAYDDRDRLTYVEDGNGEGITYGYDAMDRLVEVSGADEQGDYVPVQFNSFDRDGNLTGRYFGDTSAEFFYSPRNQVTYAENTRGSANYGISYDYDPSDNLIYMDSASGETYFYYDPANRLVEQEGPTDGMEARFEYDKADRRTKTTYPNGFVVNATYDRSGRQTALNGTTTNGTKRIDRTYRWTDGNGKDTSQLRSETREGTRFDYSYDSLNQLTARNSSSGNLSYSLDRSANLTQWEGRSGSVNAAGQLSRFNGQTVTHDRAGNLTAIAGGEATNTYSRTQQLLSSTTRGEGTIDFTYDSLDQSQRAVIRQDNAGVITEQVLENTAIGITAITTNGARSTFVRDSGGMLLGQTTEDGDNLYAVVDYQGSTLALIDDGQSVAAKYQYKPYGDTQHSGWAATGNPFRWIGSQQLDDAHGTYLTGYRQHDPFTARFTQPDPSGQEPNPYTYGLANPCTYSDPSGLNAAGCGLAIIAAAGATLVTAAGFAGLVLGVPLTGGASAFILAAGSSGAVLTVAGAWGGAAYACSG